MDISSNKLEDITILTLKGRADAANVSKMESICNKLIEGHETNILIDCTNLDYISSAGLRVLLKIAKTIKKNAGNLAVAHLNDYVKEVFHISGFSDLFPVFNTVVEGLSKLHKPQSDKKKDKA